MEPSLQLCTALRYYAQGGFLPVIGDLHGISDRAASRAIHSVSEIICEKIDTFISWPDDDEIRLSKRKFYETTHGMSQILGAIDGTHVPLIAPCAPSNEMAFVNRKGYHSINTQILCSHDLKIFDIDARWPGSSHDSFILRNSTVAQKFENEMSDTWILGDSGYPLTRWLLIPVRNPTTRAEERFNSVHMHARSCVERCNGVLKMRWRCLTKPVMFRPERAARIIVACGALHNFALKHRMPFPEESNDPYQFNDNFNTYEFENPNNSALSVRQTLIQNLYGVSSQYD